MKAAISASEAERLAALRSYHILDTPPEASYDDITMLASEICATPIAAVTLIDADRQWFKSKLGMEVSETPRDVAFCAHTILTADLLEVSDAREDERFADNPFVKSDPGVRFYAGAPLITPNGQALGSVCVIDLVRRKLTGSQAASLRALSRQVVVQLELRRHFSLQEEARRTLEQSGKQLEAANARLHILSITDDVTGFHNTRVLHQSLDSFLDEKAVPRQPFSLVFFDMDGFKNVVDTHGHLLGAKVLREVAEAVHLQLGEQDRIIRYGGDEFVILLPGQTGEQAMAKTGRIRDAISSTAFLQDEGIGLKVTASFGLATFPDSAQDKKQLLLAADQCLFRSKREGRNRISA
ncbi:MAG: sensor domain-containing diguanylate cyclase [Chthoniobacteraceae bacterium]